MDTKVKTSSGAPIPVRGQIERFKSISQMKLLFIALLITFSFSAESGTYYTNFCKANPYEPECYSNALGGTDSLERERKREYKDNYYELDDYRTEPGQDMEDMRESLWL